MVVGRWGGEGVRKGGEGGEVGLKMENVISTVRERRIDWWSQNVTWKVS